MKRITLTDSEFLDLLELMGQAVQAAYDYKEHCRANQNRISTPPYVAKSASERLERFKAIESRITGIDGATEEFYAWDTCVACERIDGEEA